MVNCNSSFSIVGQSEALWSFWFSFGCGSSRENSSGYAVLEDTTRGLERRRQQHADGC